MDSGSVYLIRHGQAGPRQYYDQLSERGRQQAHRLGEYLASAGARFEAVVAGGLNRQQETAAIVLSYLNESPPLEIDQRWSEFDLDELYRELAPRLAAEDTGFCSEYEAQQAEMQNPDAPVHRQWTRCDMAVFLAWREGRITFEGETFARFCDRVRDARNSLLRIRKPAAVFTSATPISLILGWTEEMDELSAMQFAGEMFNGAFNELHLNGDDFAVRSFNSVPHLSDDLRTKR